MWLLCDQPLMRIEPTSLKKRILLILVLWLNLGLLLFWVFVHFISSGFIVPLGSIPKISYCSDAMSANAIPSDKNRQRQPHGLHKDPTSMWIQNWTLCSSSVAAKKNNKNSVLCISDQFSTAFRKWNEHFCS